MNLVGAAYPWRELLAPANVPNWSLVLVGIWAGGMAYWTLRNIEKQTDQLTIQANLMREQMDRAVHRERARLSLNTQPIRVVETGEGGLRLFSCIELTNSGHSNAHIRFSAARFLILPSGKWPLPEADPDELGYGSNTIEPSEPPVYGPVDTVYVTSSLEKFAGKVADATLRVYLYGFIEYESMGIAWHRDFGYIWTIEDAIDGTSLVFRDRKNAEFGIAGDWEQDLRQKNIEYQIEPGVYRTEPR